ncbi:MAG TPA: histidine kinase dimerization/phospho-acceptor domain-containing protein [Candidatus Sulfomarinibacteraceae bacterium]|nr:histidine kinase dimerization/phospho-acceptor domain-containing protein [Candidatus Sulfomarinibacteraceae bacterium]
MALREMALAPGGQPPVAPEVAQPAGVDLPTHDVTVSDVEGLPRYPGAVRVEYRYVITDGLAETELEGAAADLLEEIGREADRMTRLVDDLLFLARSDSESLPLELERVNR